MISSPIFLTNLYNLNVQDILPISDFPCDMDMMPDEPWLSFTPDNNNVTRFPGEDLFAMTAWVKNTLQSKDIDPVTAMRDVYSTEFAEYSGNQSSTAYKCFMIRTFVLISAICYLYSSTIKTDIWCRN